MSNLLHSVSFSWVAVFLSPPSFPSYPPPINLLLCALSLGVNVWHFIQGILSPHRLILLSELFWELFVHSFIFSSTLSQSVFLWIWSLEFRNRVHEVVILHGWVPVHCRALCTHTLTLSPTPMDKLV